jgi:hypothetical protein
MSKIENLKKVLKKALKNRICELNALIHRKNNSKSVTINF